jgi:hypothetical protein
MTMPQFTAEASLCRQSNHYNAALISSANNGGQVSSAVVGHWSIFGCQVSCIEVCTKFCRPTGWDCCKWETRCAVDWSCLKRAFGF